MSDPTTRAATHPLPGTACITLTDQVIVRVSGPGTDKFLQGQFSQQLADVTEQCSPRAAACSPKGRAYCLTRMVREGNDVLLKIPALQAEDTVAHLRKYLMLFRGTSMEIDKNSIITGLLGESAARAITTGAAHKLSSSSDSMIVPGGHLIRTMDTAEGLARFEFWQTGEVPDDLSAALDEIATETIATWQASEIAAGVPSLCPETQERYVPQMLNWQHLGGVHFKKGCYTGQEVIARMHFLGQLKKSLFRFFCPAEAGQLAPGMALIREGRAVGDVVNAVQLSDGSHQCLAVVRHDAADSELTFEQAPDVTLRQLPLPYSVPERDQERGSDT